MLRHRPLLVVGLVVIAVGLVVALEPFDASISLASPDGGVVHGTSHCGVPIRASFRSASDDNAWFAYAPATSVIASDGFGCRAPAQKRAAVGLSSVLVGAGLALGVRRRRAPLLDAAAVR